MEIDDFGFDFHKSFLSGIAKDNKKSIETALLKEMLFWALADIFHKNNKCSRTWGGLSSVCTRLVQAKS